eukprot:scaffold22560_cov135-Cylindrotheca_fusiformis.AAC.82
MSRNPRDVIQISLGPSANAVSAHSLNLQGLASTSSDRSESNVCDPQTTHSIEKNHWVPRALLIDEPTRFFISPQVSSTAPAGRSAASEFWEGKIEPVDGSITIQHEQSQWGDFFNTASILANSSHSRYYKEPESKNTTFPTDSNQRHVVWDDIVEEEEDDPVDHHQELQEQKDRWINHTEGPLQEKLDEWSENLKSSPSLTPSNWMDYLMPPYSSKCNVPLPVSHQSHMVAHWDAYTTPGLQSWKEEVLLERVRHLLEESDSCQGVSITTEGYGAYAGLTTSLLQEFQEECKSAGRIVFHITNPMEMSLPRPDSNTDSTVIADEPSWQTFHVDRLRKNMSAGLSLSHFSENAHAVLPLQLNTNGGSLFESSASLAIALESATLPFRLNARHDPRYRIGLQNAPFFGQGGADSRWGTTAQRLTVWEFLSCLQPQSRYSILELDTLERGKISNDRLWTQFKVGTSVERDQRLREYGRDAQQARPRDTLPGSWLQDTKHGGILSSLSIDSPTDRSLHHHFGLSAAVRPVLQSDLPQYLTCLMQGMGIRHRPERSMCTVLDQTLSSLTHNGYGAGAYWKSLILKQEPVVAVLGNSTRMYPYLDQTSSNMKLVMGHRYGGFYNRDVLNGVLPEAEDCHEALENCYNIRDAYQPPDGSGLVAAEADIDT